MPTRKNKMDDEHQLQDLYTWIDDIPLSRPKKNISRDFSDGVLAAEVLAHFYPRLIELHNYTPANSKVQKINNWHTLNRKVLGKIEMTLSDDAIEEIASSKPGGIERVLNMIKYKVEESTQEPAAGRLNYGQNTFPLESSSYTGRSNHLNFSEESVLQPLNSSALYQTPAAVGSSSLVLQSVVDPLSDHLSGRHPPPAPPPAAGRAGDAPTRIPLPGVGGKKGSSQYTTPSLPPIVQPTKSNSAPHGHFKDPSALNPKKKMRSNGLASQSLASRRLELAEKEQIILESQEAIQLLQMKIHRLEHLLEIKDIKIEELSKQLQSVSMAQKSKYPRYGKH